MKLKDAIEAIDGCEVLIVDEDGDEMILRDNEYCDVVSIQIVSTDTMLVIVG